MKKGDFIAIGHCSAQLSMPMIFMSSNLRQSTTVLSGTIDSVNTSLPDTASNSHGKHADDQETRAVVKK